MANFNDNNDIYKAFGKAFAGAIGFLLGILAMILLAGLCGCTTTKYVPVEHTTLRTDTVYRAVWYTDSIIDRDTVRITEDGKEIIKWRVRTKNVHDTIYETKHDSIYVDKVVEVEKVKEVERKLTWWQSLRINVGGIAIFLAIILGAGWVYRKFRK